MNIQIKIKIYQDSALAGVAQWIEHWTANQRVAGLIPTHSTCLGLRVRSPVGGVQEATTH